MRGRRQLHLRRRCLLRCECRGPLRRASLWLCVRLVGREGSASHPLKVGGLLHHQDVRGRVRCRARLVGKSLVLVCEGRRSRALAPSSLVVLVRLVVRICTCRAQGTRTFGGRQAPKRPGPQIIWNHVRTSLDAPVPERQTARGTNTSGRSDLSTSGSARTCFGFNTRGPIAPRRPTIGRPSANGAEG